MSELPVGGIIFWPSGTLSEPDKWSICDGRSQGADTSLGKLLGSRFGSSATGAPLLPDVRGTFVRGARRTEAAGVSEDSAFQSHSHGYNRFPAKCDPTQMVKKGSGSEYPTPGSTEETHIAGDGTRRRISDHETRPVNIYLHFLIHTGTANGR
jgi:microcystin-dependent protein